MVTTMIKIISIAFLLIVSLHAQSDVTIKNIKFEKPIVGKKISQKVLSNHVTLLYIWSASKDRAKGADAVTFGGRTFFRREATYASMATDDFKYLKKEYEKTNKKGLMIIAAHAKFRNSSVTDLEMALTIPHDTPFPVYTKSINSVYSDVRAPYAYVFDVGGKAVYQGRSLRLGIKTAKKLLKDYQKKIGPNVTAKFFKSEFKSILQGKRLGIIHKKISKAVEKAQGEKKEEANVILTKLEYLFEMDKELLDAGKLYDPKTYVTEGAKLAEKWRGYEKGDELASAISSFKKSKSFKRSLKAHKIYKQALKSYISIKAPANSRVSFDDKTFRKKNRKNIAQLTKLCLLISKKYDDTLFAIWANDVLKQINK